MRGRILLFVVVLVIAAGCQGCPKQPYPNRDGTMDERPVARLFLLSNIAGVIEPCGCTKDQLGGIDHLAAIVRDETKGAERLVLGAGPMLFMEPRVEHGREAQDMWKAEAIAASLKDLGMYGWAPGVNDWAAGSSELKRLLGLSGSRLLGANLKSDLTSASSVVTIAGTKIGVFGISEPKSSLGQLPEGVAQRSEPVVEQVKEQVAELKKLGARLLVALLSMPRGEALRVADAVPDLHVMVIGDPAAKGALDDEQPAPQLVGSTLVVETANHGQSVVMVDLVVDGAATGDVVLSDVGGVKKAEQVTSLNRRIRELEIRINHWEKGGAVSKEDLAARKRDLSEAIAQRAELEKTAPSVQGSYFRYAALEVRAERGVHKDVAKRITAYYKQVNEHNKKAFADLAPEPAAKGEASYIGVEKCTKCHAPARKVWNKTAHARAYRTLVTQFKEYNLDCVGCHVTGYSKPGGSTVTHNAELKDVQCEVCHGPGSRHADKPQDKGLIISKQPAKSCVDACHHPPHVSQFDPASKMSLILGPGHGVK